MASPLKSVCMVSFGIPEIGEQKDNLIKEEQMYLDN
jgi:hypothetical protein